MLKEKFIQNIALNIDTKYFISLGFCFLNYWTWVLQRRDKSSEYFQSVPVCIINQASHASLQGVITFLVSYLSVINKTEEILWLFNFDKDYVLSLSVEIMFAWKIKHEKSLGYQLAYLSKSFVRGCGCQPFESEQLGR